MKSIKSFVLASLLSVGVACAFTSNAFAEEAASTPATSTEASAETPAATDENAPLPTAEQTANTSEEAEAKTAVPETSAPEPTSDAEASAGANAQADEKATVSTALETASSSSGVATATGQKSALKSRAKRIVVSYKRCMTKAKSAQGQHRQGDNAMKKARTNVRAKFKAGWLCTRRAAHRAVRLLTSDQMRAKGKEACEKLADRLKKDQNKTIVRNACSAIFKKAGSKSNGNSANTRPVTAARPGAQ